MEILALYTSADSLETALAAGARHLAATLEGFALVYRTGTHASEPDGWAGFSCPRDAEEAGKQLARFRAQVEESDQPLRMNAPETPPRIWERAAGGVYGFPLRHDQTLRGIAITACPGTWPRMRNAEIESILKQITLVLDHHAMSEPRAEQSTDPSDEMLDLSEQLFSQDVELIQKTGRIDQLQQDQGDLVESMTYELRHPLNIIVEKIISALAGEHERLSETGRGALRSALDEGNSLLRLLQNISDLWRIKQGKIRIETQDVNIPEVIEEAIFNVRDNFQPDVILEKKLTSPLPKIQTDLGKLNQILFHLLDNAAKFTRRGRIELSVAIEDGVLRCSVTDTGIGISADDHAKIFDEFFQVDPSPGGDHRGAGLGLTLTLALVERMGGSLEFSSEVGRGSRFAFSLPVEEI